AIARRLGRTLLDRAVQESELGRRRTLIYRAIACLNRGVEAAPDDEPFRDTLTAAHAALWNTYQQIGLERLAQEMPWRATALAPRRLGADLPLALHDETPGAGHGSRGRHRPGEQGAVERGRDPRLRRQVAHRGVRGEDVALVRVEVRIAPVHTRRGHHGEADDLPGPDEIRGRAGAEDVLRLLRDGQPGSEPRENRERQNDAPGARP